MNAGNWQQPMSTLRSVRTADEQMKAYTVGTRVYGQVLQLQKSLSETSYKFVAVTGAVWAAVFTDKLALPPAAKVAILALHAVTSVCLLLYVASLRNAMLLRFSFLPRFGEKFYPDIEEIGKEAFRETFRSPESAKAKTARWGRQMWVWHLVPACGCGASAALIIWELLKH
jgi:hypothetical protein